MKPLRERLLVLLPQYAPRLLLKGLAPYADRDGTISCEHFINGVLEGGFKVMYLLPRTD